MNLLPHQQRVIDEKAELDSRLNKLLAFTAAEGFFKLQIEEQGRMKEQAEYMQAYSNVLGARIAAFAG